MLQRLPSKGHASRTNKKYKTNNMSEETNCPQTAPCTIGWSEVITTDEAASTEFYTGGAKLFPLPGEEGRISVEALQTGLAHPR